MCTAGTSNHLWLGVDGGGLVLLSREKQLTRIQAFDYRILSIHEAKGAGCVVCIGQVHVFVSYKSDAICDLPPLHSGARIYCCARIFVSCMQTRCSGY